MRTMQKIMMNEFAYRTMHCKAMHAFVWIHRLLGRGLEEGWLGGPLRAGHAELNEFRKCRCEAIPMSRA